MDLWIFWFVVGFQAIIGSAFAGAIAYWAYMRGSGRWGGGKEVIDLRPTPIGTATRFRMIKKGSLYMQKAGGGEAIITRVLGLFKKEDLRIKEDQLIYIDGETFMLDDENGNAVQRIFHRERTQWANIVTHAYNELAYLHKKLGEKEHNPQELMDRAARLARVMADAMLPKFKPDKKKTGGN